MYNLAKRNNNKKQNNMKTIIFFSVASTGILTNSIWICAICVGLSVYLFIKWELKKDLKVEIESKDITDNDCKCENEFCNEHCANVIEKKSIKKTEVFKAKL